MTITVRVSAELMQHLSTHQHDEGTVASLLFEGGRLSYPGRMQLEHALGNTEPYTLAHEARVIDGLPSHVMMTVRALAQSVVLFVELDPTLELLWATHDAWSHEGISLDRLVAALVGVEILMADPGADIKLLLGAELLVRWLHTIGLPPTRAGLEELFDGAPPACVGLGLVEL